MDEHEPPQLFIDELDSRVVTNPLSQSAEILLHPVAGDHVPLTVQVMLLGVPSNPVAHLLERLSLRWLLPELKT